MAGLDKAIETAKESIATLASEMAALIAGIKTLDQTVQEATENRKAENVEFKVNMAADRAAKELIGCQEPNDAILQPCLVCSACAPGSFRRAENRSQYWQ